MGFLVPAPVSKEETERIVADKLRWILQSSAPLAAIVFGSAARGEMTERSDVDIALVFPDEGSLKASRKAKSCTEGPREPFRPGRQIPKGIPGENYFFAVQQSVEKAIESVLAHKDIFMPMAHDYRMLLAKAPRECELPFGGDGNLVAIS